MYSSIQNICAGYEIGWEYAYAVNFGEQTFSSFAMAMNSKYQMRRMLPTHFMQPPKFIEGWFGWGRYMELDFCRKCSSCKGCDILACDGTKLGVSFSNAFVDPIKLLDDVTAIPKEMRRIDRCFIMTSEKSHPTFFQSLRSHLRAICRSVECDDGILNKVAFEEKANFLNALC